MESDWISGMATLLDEEKFFISSSESAKRLTKYDYGRFKYQLIPQSVTRVEMYM